MFTGIFNQGFKHGYGREIEGKHEWIVEYESQLDEDGIQILIDKVRNEKLKKIL